MASGEQRVRARIGGQRQAGKFSRGASRKIHDFESFFDVQFTGFAVRVHAVVVIDAVGQVGVFLDLENEHVRADGVGRAGGNEESVGAVDFVGLEKAFE